jgi:hypothetical protein
MIHKRAVTVKRGFFKDIFLNRSEITGESLDSICKYNPSEIAIESENVPQNESRLISVYTW